MKQSKLYTVYILTNKYNTVFYIGVTSKLAIRIDHHKNKVIPSFTSRYNLTKLVYYETTEDVTSAITREKQSKGWSRKKKKDLITSFNPKWKDLSESLS
jgi:putative endonuclease